MRKYPEVEKVLASDDSTEQLVSRIRTELFGGNVETARDLANQIQEATKKAEMLDLIREYEAV